MGTDVSGHVGTNRHAMYISFVLGTDESINRAYKRLGVKNIHMSQLSQTKRDKIIKRLSPDTGIVVVCAYVEKQRTINLITSDPKFDRHRNKSIVHRHFNHLLWRFMRETIEQFAADHRCEVHDISAQCDNDMLDVMRQWRVKTSYKGKAHEIADIVGWCNSHHIPINMCREIDLQEAILNGLRRDLIR